MSNPFVPILIMLGVALAMALGGLAASAVIGPKVMNRVKLADYECGVEPTPQAEQGGRFPIRFYLVAMTFIIFDIEVVFLIPWAFIYREFLANQIAILGPILFFIGVLVIGLFYEIKKGALEWEK